MAARAAPPRIGSPALARRALVALLALALLGGLAATGTLHRLELWTRDWRIASGVGRKAPGSDIVIAWLDQESMDYLRAQGVTWPYPRSFWGEAIDYVLGGGARAVVLDVLFTEPGLSADDDRELGQVLAKHHADVLAMKLVDWRDGGFDADETKRLDARGRPLQDLAGLPSARGAALPIPELEAHADELGFVEVRADADKVYRHYDLLRACRGQVYPSLALAAAMLVTGSKDLRREAGRLRFGQHSVPVGGDGAMALAFRGPPLSFAHVQFVNIVQSITLIDDGKPPIYPAERFKDKVVLFGINAAGQEDVLPAPLSRSFPGPELHATALDNLLRGDALAELPLDWPLAIAPTLLAAAAAFLVPSVALGLVITSALLLLAAGAAFLLFAQGLVLPLAAPLAGTLLGSGCAFVWRLAVEGREKRELRRAFASYMAPEVVEEVLSAPGGVQLGGETRQVTLLFTDLAGFTSFAEAQQPPEVVAFLNAYFTRMCDRILAEKGVIDKFIGDAIMAIFGAPVARDDHAVRAVRAALGLVQESARLADELRRQGKPVVATRVGVHSGPAVVGNMGSARRFNYTAIGDTVNLASRLEGANKVFHTSCLVSEAAWERTAGAVAGREVGRIRVQGRVQPITVFEPLGADASPDFLARWAEALELLRRGDASGALRAFAAARELRADDHVGDLYAERLRTPGWDGVFVLEGK